MSKCSIDNVLIVGSVCLNIFIEHSKKLAEEQKPHYSLFRYWHFQHQI